jgi:hypothetical protein
MMLYPRTRDMVCGMFFLVVKLVAIFMLFLQKYQTTLIAVLLYAPVAAALSYRLALRFQT